MLRLLILMTLPMAVGCSGGSLPVASRAEVQAAQAEAESAMQHATETQQRLAAAQKELDEARQQAKPSGRSPQEVLAAWRIPDSTEPQDSFPSAERTSPYVQVFSSAKPFGEIWEFYARKCGLPEDLNGIPGKYQEGTRQTFGHVTDAGAMLIVTEPGGNPRTGRKDTTAHFTFQGTDHAVTVLLHARKIRQDLDQADSPEVDSGAQITLIGTVR